MKTPTIPSSRLHFLMGVTAAIAAAAPAQGQRPARLEGIWELSWQSAQGPLQREFIVIQQSGNTVFARLNGQSAVSARGIVSGTRFMLQGWRLAVPYSIQGRWQGDRLEGSLQMLRVTHRFTGRRRH